MATALQRTRFWSDTGTTIAVFTEAEVDAIFTEAAEVYTDTDSMTAYTRVLGLRRLFASAAKLADYKQNQSEEKQSQIFKHLKELLKFWQGELDDAISAASTG